MSHQKDCSQSSIFNYQPETPFRTRLLCMARSLSYQLLISLWATTTTQGVLIQQLEYQLSLQDLLSPLQWYPQPPVDSRKPTVDSSPTICHYPCATQIVATHNSPCCSTLNVDNDEGATRKSSVTS